MKDKKVTRLAGPKFIFPTNNKTEIILLFFICLFISFSFGSQYLKENNYNYAIEEMHTYDNSLYSLNINVVDNGYSPRFYANHIMSFLMHILGSNWYSASMVIIRFNFILYALAATLITLRICKNHRLLCGVMVSTCLMTESLISLAFGISDGGDVFLGTAIPVAMMGLSFILGETPRWMSAWILISLAGFLHVHEGMWAGCVAGFIWLGVCMAERKLNWTALRGIIVYIVSMALIIGPSLLNADSVDGNLFVQIYAFIRTPHHLLLSAWGKQSIVQSGVLLALSALVYLWCCKKYMQTELKKKTCEILLLATLWIGLLFTEYFATEIHPISFIVTMYLPKCFKYITILGALSLIKNGLLLMRKKRYISAVMVIFIPLLPSGEYYFYAQIVLFAAFFALELTDILNIVFSKLKIEENGAVLEILMSILLILATFNKLHVAKMRHLDIFVYLLFIILLFEFLPHKIRNLKLNKVFLSAITGVLVILSTDGFIFHINGNEINYIGECEFIKSGMDTSIYTLATEFKENIVGEALFLADPDSSASNAFQLVSQKSCYALYKNTPSNKRMVLEWYGRIINIRKITTCNANDLKDLMDEINVKYVLMTADRFDELEASDLFDVVSKNEEYAVYSIKRGT